MKIIKTPLEDAVLIEQNKHEDDRGYFIETYNQREFSSVGLDMEFVQDNHSLSHPHVLRGLHYQVERPQGKLVRCMKGSILDVIVDLRQSSPTFGQHYAVHLYRPEVMLWVPEGFAHGFYVYSLHAHVSYKTTEFYYKEYDRTLLWNDPDLGIDWGIDSPFLSAKDKYGKTFKECEKYE